MKLKYAIKDIYKRIVFNLSANNSPLFIGYYKYLYRPRKNSLMAFVDDFSKLHSGIRVVQVGANDGFNHDPLHVFIKRDNWKGVLLEPQREVYVKFLKKLHRRTTGITTVNAALDYEDGIKSIYKIAFSNARWATGLASFQRASVEKAIDSGYVEKMANKEGLKLPDKRASFIEMEQLRCVSPATLREKYGIDRIDWLQIDTEGYDFDIIKMMEIEKCRPKVIVFEHDHLSAAEYENCCDFLLNRNYALRKFGINTAAMLRPLDGFSHYFVNGDLDFDSRYFSQKTG